MIPRRFLGLFLKAAPKKSLNIENGERSREDPSRSQKNIDLLEIEEEIQWGIWTILEVEKKLSIENEDL